MVDEIRLTEWGRKLKSPEKGEREEAAKRITKAFTKQLLAEIRKELDRKITRRIDPEDVLQSVLGSFFRRDPSFANRNQMFVYLQEIAVHKAKNVVRDHHRKRRDINKEVNAASASSQDNLLERGAKPSSRAKQVRRPYQRQMQLNPVPPAQEDSFFSDATVQQMCYGSPPDAAALFVDLLRYLEDFDARQDDKLYAIVRHRLEGRSNAEIAKELGIALRTVERKLDLVDDLWHKSIPIRLKTENDAKADGRLVVVPPKTTVADVLKRLGLPVRPLIRLVSGKPERSFAPSDELHGLIDSGDILLLSRQ